MGISSIGFMALLGAAIWINTGTWAWICGGLSLPCLITACAFACWADGVTDYLRRKKRQAKQTEKDRLLAARTGYGTQQDSLTGVIIANASIVVIGSESQ